MASTKNKKRTKKRKATIKKRATKKRAPKKKKVIKKRVTRKIPGKKKVQRKPGVKKLKENTVGIVTHYFPQVRAAAIKLKAPLSLEDSVRIKGHTTDFTQTVNSLQINRQLITKAKKGQEIGLLVISRVRRKDVVYKI